MDYRFVNYEDHAVSASGISEVTQCLLIQVDDDDWDCTVEIVGFGSGDARVAVKSLAAGGDQSAELIANVQSVLVPSALVWLRPVTIAHMIADTINNT